MFGLGGYAADFFQGTRDQSQLMLGQRQAAARAFQEFKAQNPTATYAEFQQFVDNMSGGSNYLRGAMPARDVLETLGKQNEINRRTQATQQQTQALASKQQQQATIRNAINEARRAGVRDPLKITEMVAGQLGIDKAQDAQGFLQLEDMMREINPESVITELDQTDFIGSLEMAQKGIRAGLFDSEDAIYGALPSHLRGTPLEEKYKAQTKGLYGNFMGERREALFKSAMSTSLPLIEAGATEATIGPIVQEIYGKMYPGAPTDLKMISDVTRDITKRINEDRNKVMAEEQASDIAKFNDFATSNGVISIMRNNPGNADELLRAEAKLVFPNLGDAELNAMVEAAKRRAVLVVEDQIVTEYKTVEAKMPSLVSERLKENANAIKPLITKETPANIAGAISILQAQGNIIEPGAVPGMIEAASSGKAADMSAAELATMFAKQFREYVVDPRQDMEAQLQSSKPEKREERLGSATEFLTSAVRQVASKDYMAARKITDPAARMDALSAVLEDAQSLLMESEAIIEDADAESQPWALPSSTMSAEAYSQKLRNLGKRGKDSLAQIINAIEMELNFLKRGGRFNAPTPRAPQGAAAQPDAPVAPSGERGWAATRQSDGWADTGRKPLLTRDKDGRLLGIGDRQGPRRGWADE